MIDKKGKKRRLSFEERKKIEDLLHKNWKHSDIADEVKIAKTTLYREFKKCQGPYNAQEAHKNTYRKGANLDYSIIGKRFGLLTVLEYVNSYNRRTWWRCICDCGKQCITSRKILVEYCSIDRPLSCGCIAKESKGPNGQVPIEEAALRKFQDLLSFRKISGNCWIWTGYKQKGNLPKTSWKNKAMSVRKCMYLIINGILKEPNPVFAKCGNLSCFNPDHITLERPQKRSYYKDQEVD